MKITTILQPYKAGIPALLAFSLLSVPVTEIAAQQTDPTLTAAVIAQTAELKSIHKKRKTTQERIIAAEAAVTIALDRVHSVENKMLEYLSNAQGAMQNLYQIKRAGELVLTEIPKNCDLLRKSVPGHLKGTAIALLVSDELTDAATQMAALYPFMKQLVTSGSYNVTDSDGNKQKHKVNLLNSAERYYIANEVVTRLETINTDPGCWHGRCARSHGTTFGFLDPDGWASVMSGKAIAENLVWGVEHHQIQITRIQLKTIKIFTFQYG